jgi:hypothetical protein
MISFGKTRAYILIWIISFLAPAVFSQPVDSLRIMETRLLDEYNALMEKSPFKRFEKAQEFYHTFCSALENRPVFDYPFERLPNIGKIYSSDQRVRIFTWNIPVDNNDNLYFGIAQYYSRPEKKVKIVRFNEQILTGADRVKTDWQGALYYNIVETRQDGQNYYTLLGFDPYNPLSNKKIIDVVSIDDNDGLYFCENLFLFNGTVLSRLIFEYNEKASMSLKYNEDKKMIVFDHLSPSRPSLEGKYEFYGPDFTYDGLKWEKGIWVYYSNIDVTN